MNRALLSRAFPFLALVLLPGCDILTGDDDGAERARLEQAHRRWLGAGISSYRYELRRLCFCPAEAVGPFAITVRAGAVVSVVHPPTGAPVSASPERHPTVEDLFAQVDAALDRKPARLEVAYDGSLGYPTRLAIDYVAMAVDDEITVEATGLSRLD